MNEEDPEMIRQVKFECGKVIAACLVVFFLSFFVDLVMLIDFIRFKHWFTLLIFLLSALKSIITYKYIIRTLNEVLDVLIVIKEGED